MAHNWECDSQKLELSIYFFDKKGSVGSAVWNPRFSNTRKVCLLNHLIFNQNEWPGCITYDVPLQSKN